MLFDVIKIPEDIDKGLWYRLGDMPKDYITNALCIKAIKSNGEALQFVPKRLMTEKLCSLAVLSNPIAFKYVPAKFRTKDICDLAIREGYGIINLNYIPKVYLTQVRVMEIFKHSSDYLSLQFLPERAISADLINDFIQKTEQISINAQIEVLKNCPKKLLPEIDMMPVVRQIKNKKCKWAVETLEGLNFLPQEKLDFIKEELKNKKRGCKSKEEKELIAFEDSQPKFNFDYGLRISDALEDYAIKHHEKKYN